MRKLIPLILFSSIFGFLGAYIYQLFTPNKTINNSSLAFQREIIPTPVSMGDGTRTYDAGVNFVTASKVASPSVVYIKTVSGAQQVTIFDWFWNEGASQQVSSGSGVIVTDDGYIVTNNHVVQDAEVIEVIHNKFIYKAKLVGSDPSIDIAVLKIDSKSLPAIKVAKSKTVEVGEWVLAIGNPFNLTSTVTAGIVSAKGRNLNLLTSQFPIESFIQTDAAINPGNSGGALVNLNGELIGINTAIYSKTGSYAGYGFAVPADIAIKAVNDLIKYGMVQKVFSGMEVTDITQSIAEKLETNNLSGVVVTYVQTGGVAEKVGINKGDIIVKINNDPVTGKGDFDELLGYHYPGDQIDVSWLSDGKMKTAKILLTNQEGTTDIVRREIYSSSLLGADLESLSKVEKERYGIKSGIKIIKVRGGILARMGFTEGYTIISINKKPMEAPWDIERTLKSISGKITIETVNPQGRVGYYSFWL